MRIVFILIFLATYHFAAVSQQLINVNSINKKQINYLTFNSDILNSTFINNLNKQFGYTTSLIDQYKEAPNCYERESIESITGIIDSIQTDKIQGSLADISYEVESNDSFLLSILKIVVPEGKKRITNSTVSDYSYVFPKNYDLKHQKEIGLLIF